MQGDVRKGRKLRGLRPNRPRGVRPPQQPLAQGCAQRGWLRLTIDTDEDTMAQLRARAIAEDQTVAAVVRELLEYALEDREARRR